MDQIKTLSNKSLDLSVLTTALFGLFIFTCINYIIYFRNTKKKYNLNGPTPLPIIGNLASMLFEPRKKIDLGWREKYGKLHLEFSGSKPMVNVADVEVARQILSKDFDIFHDHSSIISPQNKFTKNFVVFLQGAHWKRVRALITPAFTSAKIKRMYKIISNCADDLLDYMQEDVPIINSTSEQSRKVTTIRKFFDLYTLNTITTCCYAIKLNRRQESDNDDESSAIIKSAGKTQQDIVEILQNMMTNKWEILHQFLLMMLPKYIADNYLYQSSNVTYMEEIESMVYKIMENRSKKGIKQNDLLQMLLDSKIDDEIDLVETDFHENHHASLTKESIIEQQAKNASGAKMINSKLVLSKEEMIANGILFILVGYETTSASLTRLSYALAHHQDIQQKLYESIKNIAVESSDDNDNMTKYNFSYDDITTCEYLDQVISETLRFLPPIGSTDRTTLENYTIEKYRANIFKGTTVLINIHSIHHDQEYWPEPEKFDPSRFSSENKDKIIPGSYIPFSLGPRHCLGMKFSLTETKLAIAKILMHYKLTPAPQSTWPPISKPSLHLLTYKTFDVVLEKRN